MAKANFSFASCEEKIETLLSTPETPDLLKAKMMTLLSHDGYGVLGEAYITQLEDDALNIYSQEGVTIGIVFVRFLQIIHALKEDDATLTNDVLEKVHEYFADYEVLQAVLLYQKTMSLLLPHIPFKPQFEIDIWRLCDMNDLVAKLSGNVLLYQYTRFRLADMWLTNSTAASCALELSEAIYVEVEDGDARGLRGDVAITASKACLWLKDWLWSQMWAEEAVDLWADFPDLKPYATDFILLAKISDGLSELKILEVLSYVERESKLDVKNRRMSYAREKLYMIWEHLAEQLDPENKKTLEVRLCEVIKRLLPEFESDDVERAASLRSQAVVAHAVLKDWWESFQTILNSAAQLYRRHGKLLDHANTRLMHSRAFFRRYELCPDMERLFYCLELGDEAVDLFAEACSLTSMTLAHEWRSFILYVGWVSGWVQFGTVLNALRSAEEAWASEREMSMFARPEAISCGQDLTLFEQLRPVYERAYRICLIEDRLPELWDWIQRGKVRSLCDQLGVEGLITVEQRERALPSPQSSEVSQGMEDVKLRQEADAMDDSLRKFAMLNTVLDAETGAPVKLHQIRRLANKMKRESPGRDVVFVDWVECLGAFWMVVLGGDDKHPSVTQCTPSVEEVKSWKKQWLDAEPGEESALQRGDLHAEDDGDFCLRVLDGLVAPLETLSRPGDLLVFSPAGILHSIPLHALWVPSRVLILERNPIVYSVSLTTFWQCCGRAKRAAQARHRVSRRGHDRKWTFAGVYEEAPGRLFCPDEQAKIYSLVPQTADLLNSESAIGTKVTEPWVRKALGQSSLFFFFGHCHVESENATEQGLTLGHRMLTVREVLHMTLKAPHVGLVTCDSASQGKAAGDEPSAIATAFLCGGAGSVLGSIWPTASQAGRRLTREMYARMRDDSAGDASVVDMAEKMRKAVLALRSEAETSQPYHWAGFVLHGCWAMYR